MTAVDMWKFERKAIADGYTLVAGVDEAGRGPLAGPVTVAAVILPFECILSGLNDSKQVTESDRERLIDEIKDTAIAWDVQIISARQIDDVNILRATHIGMRQSMAGLSPSPHMVLIDGLAIPEPPFPARNIVKGDSLSASIAAASIIAKVTRDEIMMELDKEYPQYGFAKHKGYPTPEHLQALKKYGPCKHHRYSFKPVRDCQQGELF